MVFESVVSYFLEKYLSCYLDNFDSSKLKIGIWSGDVVLENLEIKPNALDELNLPVRVVLGHLKQLKLKIPWKSLYTESVKVSIDGLTILIVPKSSTKYDAEREKKEQIDKKLNEVKKLNDIEAAKAEKNAGLDSEKNVEAKQDTFIEKIQLQVIRNLELQIKNIHIRYEDDFSKPEHPFSAGVTLDSIEIRTADENWNPAYLKESSKEMATNYINKLASLISCAIYCNSDEKLLNGHQKDEIIPLMQKMITDESNIKYMLKPLSLETKAILNMKPRQDNYNKPMFDFTIVLEKLGLSLNRLQYFDLIDMLNTIDQMSLYAKYRKFRPTSDEVPNVVKRRWLYSYRAIVEGQIRPKRDQYRWTRIQLVTRLRRDYVGILKKKLKGGKLTNEETETEKKCEEVLDVFNLVLAKKQADVEIARVKAIEKSTAKKSSWWGWASGSSSSKEDQDKLSEAENLSQEEKLKLFDAIGYTEESTFSHYPKDYVSIKLKFLLKMFEINLIDGDYKYNDIETYISSQSILCLSLENMELGLSKYPVTDGLKVVSSIKRISLTGSSINISSHSKSNELESNGVKPVMIEPDLKDQVFIKFAFELDPTDPNCDKRITAKSRSLKIIYHAITINNIVYFFQSPEFSNHSRLKNAAIKKINQVRERSVQYMKNNLSNIRFIDVNVDIEPSFLLIPQNGVFSETTKSLCVNFGCLSLKSDATSKGREKKAIAKKEAAENSDEDVYLSATDDEDDLKKSVVNTEADVIDASYWKYRIDLKQIQIILIDNMHDLAKMREITETDKDFQAICDRCFILRPLDLFFNMHQCVYTDDANLPVWKLFGNLPRIQIDLTETKLEQSLDLVLNLPLPKNDSISKNIADIVDDGFIDDFEESSDISSDGESLINTLEALTTKDNASKDSATSLSSVNQKYNQAFLMELSFEINEITFRLRENKPVNFDFIEFKIESFGTSIEIKTYSNEMNIYLKKISMLYDLFNDVNGEKLYLIRSANEKCSSDLINIRILNTNEENPQFSSLYNNCLTKIDVDLCMIDFVANLIALKNLFKFTDTLQTYFHRNQQNTIQNTNVQVAELKQSNRLASNQVLLSETAIKTLLGRKTQTQPQTVNDSNLVEFKINAKFDGLRARICTTRKNYFQADMTCFETTVTGKASETVVDISLNSISVVDLDPNSIYNKVLSLKEDQNELVKLQVTLVNPPRSKNSFDAEIEKRYQKEKFYFRNYLNEEHFDIILKANISKLRAVFLFKQLNTLMSMLKIFETEQQEATTIQNLTETKTSEIEIRNQPEESDFSFSSRVKLDVTINAPLIIVPETASSNKALLLDCGVLIVKTNLSINQNYFQKQDVELDQTCLNYRCKLPPVIEIQKVTLSKMEISKIVLEKDMEITNQLFLVDCSDLKVEVQRNMQPNVFKKIEPLSIEVIYGGLLVSLARNDYTFILKLVQNLDGKDSEIQDPDLPSLKAKTPASNSKSEDAKKQVGLEDALTIVKSNIIASLTIKVLIESLRVYLFNDEDQPINSHNILVRSNDNAFSKMEIKNLQIEVNIFEDTDDTKSNMKMLMLLDNIILDDTRHDKCGKKAIRLIEKYFHDKKSAPVSMVTMIFESKVVKQDSDSSGNQIWIPEKYIKGTVECLRLCVNVDYLLLLHQFFIEGLPNMNDQSEEVLVETTTTMTQSKSLPSVQKQLEVEQAPIKQDKIICDIRIDYPQFILYENQYELKKSNSLIINGMFHAKVDLTNERIKVHTMLSDLMVRLKSVRTSSGNKQLKQSKRVIIPSTSMSLSGVIDNRPLYSVDDFNERKAQSFILDLHDINFNMSPQVLNTSLKMIASIQNSLNQKFKTEVIEVREETQVALQSIFQAVEFNTNDFWFTRPKALTRRLSASSLSSAETALTTTTDSSIGSKFNSTEMIIRTAKIFVKLEADVSEQIPLLGLSLSLHGEITNWTSKLGMSFTAAIEMAYFNESRSAWEPVIEPIEYNNDKFSPYEISIEMITNELEQSDLSKMSHRKKAKSGSSEQPNTNLLPLRTFHMHSSRSLQLVVTRTLLGMLDTISKTLALNESVDATSQVDDEYETYEREEEMLLEKLKSRKLAAHAKDQEDEVERPSTAHLENLDDKNREHDDDSENFSFNFLVKNQLGVDVQLDALQGFHFLNLDLIDANRQPEFCIDKIVLKNDSFCPIKLANNMSTVKSAMLTNNEQDSKRKSVHFRLNITESNWEPVDVVLNHLQYNAYYLSSQTKKHNETMVICETVTNMDKRRLYLRSQIQIINMFQMGVDISFPGSQSQILGFKNHTIKPGKRWSLPINILNNATNKIEIAPISPEGKYEKQTISWESDKKNVLLEFSKHIFIQVIIEKEPLDLSIKSAITGQQSMSQVDFIYDIVLLPTLTLYNYLPYSINYNVDNSSIGSKTNIEKKCLEPGESTKLVNAKVGSSYLLLEMLNYAQETWYASQHIEFNPKSDQKGVKTNEEVNMIDFRCRDSRIITLQYTCSLENSCLTFSLYAPYWILNQTTLKLEYKFKSCDDDINEIDSNLAANTPIFFKINSKAYNMPKKEIMFRVRENNDLSEWSGSFLIDTAGNKGTICARSRSQKIYEIGVDISLSTTGLTKIIKLTPYYLLVNNTELMLDIRELIDNQILLNKLVLQPKSIMPFWPSNNTSNKQKNAFKIRVLSSEADLDSNIPFTSPFWYNSKHSTLLKLQNNPYTEALFVDCIPSEEVVRTVFKPFSYGTVPVLVLNCLSSRLPVVIKQNEEDSDEISIMPGKYHMKTWRNPIGKREIVWSCGLARNQIYNLDTIQSSHQFDISQTNIGFALSFLDGLQRVLMFVENIDNLSEEVIGYKKIPGDEYILDLDSLGLSLIDDKSQIEIFYMSITSSSISWGQKQGRKNNVFKAFSNHKMERLEDAYQKHIQENKSTAELVKIDEEEEVDFDKMILFVGKSRVHLERHHASSVYVNFFKSMNQTNLHLMVNKIQIDNQLHESVFPVVFAKVQPPKTVATHNINKPIIEMSMILSHSQRTRTNEMKYFKVLIQEFFVKLDIMFINALVSILTDKSKIERKYVNHSNRLFKEIESINKSFHDMFHSLEDIDVKTEKIYFDICHISPIKMHLSFSLLGSDAFKDASILLDNPFFKSIGLVLTDMQDVVFKLGYFETVNSVYTYPEMTSVVVEHYKTQVIKQAYVLLLGLDVLGNPFGVIRGLFEGVESLFYEPYAGIVQGPGEFVEGVGLGLGKLLGSTLGGAAGAFSKITGTLGKGLATLSMDKDFQASRQKNTDQSFLQNVGQNLVMGVVSGVTGIVEKPLEGAKTGQFGGFLGGLGKGLLGVVTKPTAGLVDFTSQSLEGIRKTVVQEEKVNRVRPPRCLYKDSIIRPYKLKEAQGVFILKNVEKHIFQNDRLLDCLDVSTDPKILLILTNRHLILVKENLMFKKWVLEWSYELNQLADIPKFSHHSLKFYFRTNERKLFNSKDTIEQSVSIRDETEAKKFVTKITQAISEHSS